MQPTTTGFSVQKRAFAAEEADVDIDVTDPEFWQKVLPDDTSPARLLSRLNDRTATATAESRDKFIEDVEEMVTGQLGELEEGRPVSKKDMDTACNVLLQVSQMKSTFTQVRCRALGGAGESWRWCESHRLVDVPLARVVPGTTS